MACDIQKLIDHLNDKHSGAEFTTRINEAIKDAPKSAPKVVNHASNEAMDVAGIISALGIALKGLYKQHQK